MARPMLDGFELQNVQTADGEENEALAQHGVPALEGDFLQDLGRRATRFALAGVLTGADAAGALETLREKHRAATPVSFVTDIATATSVGSVLIEELGVRELAGRPERFEYEISLIELVAQPAQIVVIPPVPVKPPPDPQTSVLTVRVIVDDDSAFDMSKVTVRASGTTKDGAQLDLTLTDRTNDLWTADPMAPGSYTVSAVTDDPPMSGSTAANVAGGQTAQVEIHLHGGPAIAHAFVVHYWFDKAIVEPCLRRVLRDVAAYASAHAAQKMLIVGHTDLSGPGSYNQALSERRARGVYAYLTAGRDLGAAVAEWDALRKSDGSLLADRWGTREFQLLLQGLGYYGGAIDELHGPLTDAAIRNFQSDKGLAADGIVGNVTWHALVEAYLSVDRLALPESQFFSNCSGEVVKWLGSGEQDPVRNTEDAWRPNRRTEIVFVRADALAGKAAPPVTFALPAPGAVNANWCAGTPADPRVVLSRGTQKPGTFLVQPAEPGTVIVEGSMTFEDGSPAANVAYVLTAPDGEYMDGERPNGAASGRPVEGKTDAAGSFAYPSKPKGAGVYVLSVGGAFVARLKSDVPGSGETPVVCAKLEPSQKLEVVLAPADGADPRRKLTVTLFGRAFEPLAATAVTIAFPDGTTQTATTDAHGRFSVVMNEAHPGANLRYAASDDPNDIVQRDYFIDPGDIATAEGVSNRLNNLGLLGDDLTAAVTQFQALVGLPASGVVDGPTRDRLARVYDGDEPLVSVLPADPSGSVGVLTGDGPPEANSRLDPGPDMPFSDAPGAG